MEWTSVLGILSKIWNFRLFIVDDSPITLGKLITAVILVAISYILSKRLAKQVERRILVRLEIDPSMQHTLHQIIFYVFIVIFTLFTLNFLSIPITIFTVLGGALAIGVGFGSQKIVNNFISGLVLMIERPVRVGDVIQVADVRGIVEDIGPRSTKIKSMDNTHIVVPNSIFTEEIVLNWTLSDDIVRGKIKVGVAYGSPVRKVEQLLMQAAQDQDQILNRFGIEVIFEDFADNSLNFEVYYFNKVENVFQLKKIQSNLRYRIDELFHENGIVIAFPQRDIHIDTSNAIPVRVLSAADDVRQ